MALNIGDVIDGKYRIVRLLGEGGMGAVFEGENTRIHRRVAIKVLHSGVASNEDAVARFEREAQAAGRIGSEHIVEVLDLGNLADGDRYMVMEFLEGESLSDRISSRGQLSTQFTAGIMVDMLEGLRAAHDAGIIHRDLKPDNVFLLTSRGGKKDFVKIVDFGISKFNVLGGNSEFSMTRTGAVMGTPYYMSPEQAKGNRDVDHRADLYAVGVILYECVAGEVPFNAETFNELLFKIVLEQPTPLTDRVAGCDPTFAAIVNKAMARDPAARFQNAIEFQEALRAWLAGQPVLVDQTANYGTPSLDRTQLPGANTQLPGMNQTRPGSAAEIAAADRPKTMGAWANTGEFAGEKKSNRGIVLGAAAAVLVLVGGGFAMMKKSAGEDEKAAAAAAAQAADDQRRVTEQAKLEVERAKLETERAKAEQARLEAERAKDDVEDRERERLEAEKAAALKAAATPVAAAKGGKPVAPAPATPAKPAPAPAAAPASAPAAPSGGGRKIRTDL